MYKEVGGRLWYINSTRARFWVIVKITCVTKHEGFDAVYLNVKYVLWAVLVSLNVLLYHTESARFQSGRN